MALAQRIQVVTELLKNDSTAETSAAQRDALVNVIITGRHSNAELVQAAGRVPMMNWFCATDMSAVQGALASSGPKPGNWRPQAFHNFVSILPESVWDDLTNTAMDVNQKGKSVIKALQNMGLVHPSEPTFARLAGLMAVALCGSQARDHTPEQMRDLYDHMKAMWKASRGPDPIEFILELPESKFAFQSLHPLTYAAAFPDGSQPGTPRLSIVDVCACASKVAMRRRTSSSPAHLQRGISSPSLAGGGGQDMQAVIGMFGNMMERMFSRFSGNTLDNGANLTFTQPGGSGPASWGSPGNTRSALMAAAAVSGGATGAAPVPLVPPTALPLEPKRADAADAGGVAALEGPPREEDKPEEPKVPPKKIAKMSPDDAANLLLEKLIKKRDDTKAKSALKQKKDNTVSKKPAMSAPPKLKAKWNDEEARGQILCRCGKGPGSTKAFRYGKHAGKDCGSKAAAIANAKGWCKGK